MEISAQKYIIEKVTKISFISTLTVLETRMKRYSFPVLLSAVYILCNGAPAVDVPLEEQGGFFEGDLNLTPTQIRDIFVNRNAGLLNTNFRWTTDSVGFVTVPFLVRPGTPYGEYNFEIIK